MAEAPEQVMSLLAKMRIFEGLDERQLAHIAARTRLVNLKANEILPLGEFKENEDYPFFAIFSGELRLTPTRWKSKIDEILRPGDFIGADALFFGSRPKYQVNALTDSLLLRIESETLDGLLVEIPRLKENLKAIVDVYRQIRSKRFDWLGEDEIVHVVLRKHAAYLLVSLILPLVLAWIGVLVFFAGSFIQISSIRIVAEIAGAMGMIAALVWALWAYIDWRNDYYIVTDRRVVWLENVIGLYQSRQESPLTAIKSERVQSTLLGRYLGYGDLQVQTLMGSITFRSVGQPEQIRRIIIAQQAAAFERQHEADLEAMKELIQKKLEPAPMKEQAEGETTADAEPSPSRMVPMERSSPLIDSLINFFKTRVEQGDTITYRKHIFVLLTKVFLPSLLMFILVAGNLYLFWRDINGPMILLVSATVFIGLALWWLYQFVDWRNDIYRITSDKIIDSERKPLGREVTKSAYLENILNLDYERLGLLGILLNFGNVIINVGTENKFIFWRIHNPARAQQDIFNRMYANRLAKQEGEATKEREQMADYFVVYARSAEESQGDHNPANQANEPD